MITPITTLLDELQRRLAVIRITLPRTFLSVRIRSGFRGFLSARRSLVPSTNGLHRWQLWRPATSTRGRCSHRTQAFFLKGVDLVSHLNPERSKP